MHRFEKPVCTSVIVDVFDTIKSGLKNYIMRFLVHPQDVEDALQETLLRSWESEQRQIIRAPKSFLFRVARNIALSEIAKKSRQLTVYTGDSPELDDTESGISLENTVEADEKLRSLTSVIASLPPQCQRVFVMRKVYGFTHDEIARRLNISTRTVEQHLTKGLKRCQDSMLASTVQRDNMTGRKSG